MAVTKLSLYNDTLQLLGERRLASDTEDREPRYDLDSLYDNGAVDYCLEVVKPRYATLFAEIAGQAPGVQTEYDFQIDLPADFVAVFNEEDGTPAVYQDGRGESPITRFIREGDHLHMDIEPAWLRYVIAHTDPQLAIMPTSFGRVVSAYMARELSWKYDPDAEEQIQLKLDQRIEASKAIEVGNQPQARGFAPDLLTDELRHIYNDCLQICGLDPILRNDDDSLAKNRISIALNNGLVGSVLEDTSWSFGLQSAQLFADPSINPPWGYEYVCALPANMHRLNGVYQDELMRTPIRDYIDQIDTGTGNRHIISSYSIIYVEFVSKLFLTTYTQWPDYFKRLVAARMALDANIPGADKQTAVAQYTQRRKEAFSTSAINGPPKTLAMGKWSRSRLYRGNMNRDRP